MLLLNTTKNNKGDDNMNFRSVIALFAVAVLVIVPTSVAITSADAAAEITVKDGTGAEFTFDGPVDKIITVGKGLTSTAIQVGALDKIVVCDSYSKDKKDPTFTELLKRVEEGKIAANGNIYSSGRAALLTDIIDASDPEKRGLFNTGKDVIFISGSDSYLKEVLPTLQEKGFKNIMVWKTVTEYSDVKDLVNTVSMVCNGEKADIVKQMDLVSEKIADGLKDITEKKNAFYGTITSGEYVVGNTGSLATSMLIEAGANVITLKEGASSTYQANYTDLVASVNGDVIIFLDYQIAENEEKLNEVKKMVGNSVQLVPLKSTWNNFTPDSMHGVWTMACALYPDTFKGEIPTVSGSETDYMPYIIGAIVAVVLIGAVAFIFMRK